MKHIILLCTLALLSATLTACGTDRTVVVQPQPTQVDHVVVEHDSN